MPRLWRLPDRGAGHRRAFTVLELMVVIACVALLAALVLPALGNADARAQRINCSNQLRSIGVSFRLWSWDHGERFPMSYVNETEGFKRGAVTNAFWYFQVMSNELATPKILICPSDTARTYASNFTYDFRSNAQVSYFLVPDADESQPAMLLTGDRNLTNGTPVVNGVLTLTGDHPVGWTAEMHPKAGNVGLSDGSVQGLTASALRAATRSSGTNSTTMRLLMP